MTVACLRRLGVVTTTRHYDAVLVHRGVCVVGPALLELILNRLGRRLVFDFDDAIFLLHSSAANRWFSWLKFPGKTATICRASRAVVVGNEFLADYARQFNANVAVVPTSIDTEVYRRSPRPRRSGPVTLGWAGSATSQQHLEEFAPVLREIVAHHGVEVRVFSDREPALPGVPFVWRRWSALGEAEVRELSAVDIGIMPMPDDVWSRGKCALKALQYMALEIPPVCSNVGANREVVRHGENGYLASTPEEWLNAVGLLVADVNLRERLGACARRTVEERYSAELCASLLEGVVRGVVGEGDSR
jgi:glycosyltransferase involved in cell wall biosynthesis